MSVGAYITVSERSFMNFYQSPASEGCGPLDQYVHVHDTKHADMLMVWFMVIIFPRKKQTVDIIITWSICLE